MNCCTCCTRKKIRRRPKPVRWGTIIEEHAVQIAALIGAVLVSGTAAASNAAQTEGITGSVEISGTIAETQSIQAEAATGAVAISGTMAETQGVQTEAIGCADFTPLDFADCVAWWRPDLGVILNGATVSDWADQSTGGHDTAQGTASRQPTFVANAAEANNQPAIDFDGGDALPVTGGFTSLNGLAGATVWVVFREDTPATQSMALYSNGQNIVAQHASDLLYAYASGSNYGNYTHSATTPITYCSVYDGTLVGNVARLKLFEGLVQKTLSMIGTIPATLATDATLVVGAYDTTGAYGLDGRFYDAAIYARALPVAQRTRLQTYAGRYGL